MDRAVISAFLISIFTRRSPQVVDDPRADFSNFRAIRVSKVYSEGHSGVRRETVFGAVEALPKANGRDACRGGRVRLTGRYTLTGPARGARALAVRARNDRGSAA